MMLSRKNQSFKYGYFAREEIIPYKTSQKKILKYLFWMFYKILLFRFLCLLKEIIHQNNI
jgi:hypothetical protein